MILSVHTNPGYDVTIERGALSKASSILSLNRRCMILTDDGVPEAYEKILSSQCKESFTLRIPQGEASKTFDSFTKGMRELLEHGFSRGDCVIALGGGVCGDLAGFIASTYMRGIDFYNIPTTLLSMVDSSIGGKTAVDFLGVKNIVGTFYQPKAVLIDPATLDTLSPRQFRSGLVEAIKMAATFDEPLFSKIEHHDIPVEEIVIRSLEWKKKIVEEDTKESGVRKVLNFGHTVGHAIESSSKGKLLHGEAVGLGMIAMSEGEARSRIERILRDYELPWECDVPAETIETLLRHDKKANGEDVDAIFVSKIGHYTIQRVSVSELVARYKEAML